MLNIPIQETRQIPTEMISTICSTGAMVLIVVGLVHIPLVTTVEASHAWSYGGTYNVKLKAKDAVVDGPWSNPLPVQIVGVNIELQNVKGGLFKVSAEIKNTGDEPISNVNWNITLRSGVFIGKQTIRT